MKYQKLTISLVTILLLVGLFLVSVLGENNKSEQPVINYLKSLKSERYDNICTSPIKRRVNNIPVKELSCAEYSFILGLILKAGSEKKSEQHFEIVNDNLWIPFVSNSSLKMSVSVLRKGQKIFDLSELFTISRENGVWKILEINLVEEKSISLFEEYKSKFDFDKYVSVDGEKVKVKERTIVLSNLSKLEASLLKFELNSLIKKLEK